MDDLSYPLDRLVAGRNYVLILQDDSTVEGQVAVANEKGVLLKPRGKSNLAFFDAAQVADWKPMQFENLEQVRLKQVNDQTIRRHLADRHGMPLSVAGALSLPDAYKAHNKLHESDTNNNISHRHS